MGGLERLVARRVIGVLADEDVVAASFDKVLTVCPGTAVDAGTELIGDHTDPLGRIFLVGDLHFEDLNHALDDVGQGALGVFVGTLLGHRLFRQMIVGRLAVAPPYSSGTGDDRVPALHVQRLVFGLLVVHRVAPPVVRSSPGCVECRPGRISGTDGSGAAQRGRQRGRGVAGRGACIPRPPSRSGYYP